MSIVYSCRSLCRALYSPACKSRIAWPPCIDEIQVEQATFPNKLCGVLYVVSQTYLANKQICRAIVLVNRHEIIDFLNWHFRQASMAGPMAYRRWHQILIRMNYFCRCLASSFWVCLSIAHTMSQQEWIWAIESIKLAGAYHLLRKYSTSCFSESACS